MAGTAKKTPPAVEARSWRAVTTHPPRGPKQHPLRSKNEHSVFRSAFISVRLNWRRSKTLCLLHDLLEGVVSHLVAIEPNLSGQTKPGQSEAHPTYCRRPRFRSPRRVLIGRRPRIRPPLACLGPTSRSTGPGPFVVCAQPIPPRHWHRKSIVCVLVTNEAVGRQLWELPMRLPDPSTIHNDNLRFTKSEKDAGGAS